ncbi:bifunctional glutamate N-acetyltransferase/amino-acid acetyltransferase ArgJ [Candidatus Stoquefichus massiliensis]|uniref:bifunctional glutamate N-acetyltransferase/amino-acid acetyltransferase ArgJ n=1 Tax=Candidatus Stoquefichus massiliensis TaxID=1470350 RepID=UPI000488E0B4|nr:bifunctional glutamate N-acetyltransferase/amino-acid acetyltransferase ArgJ [Candidatus Stoquefichus massiliensis]
MKEIQGGVCAPLGFKAAGIHCGIRKNKSKKDLALIVSDVMCHAASTYTLNKVKGAPIAVTKQHLLNGEAKAIICNSGNANTCNPDGEEIANKVCALCAKELNINENDIIVASTGVIGQPLDITPFENHMTELVQVLQDNGSSDACEGIMTTDTVKKEYAVEFELDGKTCHIGAIAKGSGMIHPNMATMLAFVTTDVNISKEILNEVVHEVVDDTFNMVSVDGDTSTNDMLSVMANGLAGNHQIIEKDGNYEIFKEALMSICTSLSKGIAKDGEGATKLLTCHVENACTVKDAKIVAKSVITSSLFKAAMFGKDANWGRILCAIGYCDANYDVDKIEVSLASHTGQILVCQNGRGYLFDENEALKILSEDEIDILINLHDGSSSATAWGCDLTYDYVKINGDYRT